MLYVSGDYVQGSKEFFAESLIVGGKKIYPFVKLNVFMINNKYVSVEYTAVALKITEENKIFFKNISMPDLEFENFKKKYGKISK